MARFHVNNDHETGQCKAGKQSCPFKGEENHFDTREEAEAEAQKRLEKEYGAINAVYKSGAENTSRLDGMSQNVKKRIISESASGANRMHPSVVAKVFANDKDELVRRRVAENVKSQNSLRKMAEDESPKVRSAVAASSKNPEVLKKLANDPDKSVRNAALKNERIPKRAKAKTEAAIKAAAVEKRKAAAGQKNAEAAGPDPAKISEGKSPEKRAELQRRLKVAADSSYEATMNDYSMASITRAENDYKAARKDAEDHGLDPDELLERK